MRTLLTDLLNIRESLVRNFGPDTAVPGTVSTVPSAGHCAVAALVVWQKLGGNFRSTYIHGVSHWFNRLTDGGEEVDVDLTEDQFGGPGVHIEVAGELHEHSQPRALGEISLETFQRYAILARRMESDNHRK